MSFADDLPTPVKRAPITKVEKRVLTKPELAQIQLRETEDSVLQDAMTVIEGAMGMLEVDPNVLDEEGQIAMPDIWLQAVLSGEMTENEARKRLRAAVYALMPGKDAPVGLKIALDIFTGIAKARAVEKGGPKSLNMVLVQMQAPMPIFDSMEEEESH